VGFYERRIFPWLNDRLTRDPELLRIRTETLASARGRVLEIGFGTGANLAHYPEAVDRVLAVEPNEGMRDRGRPILERSRIPVEMLAGSAERLPIPDASVDTAVSTLTLCSVSDPAQVLRELHRVLGPDGRLILVEHGLSDDPGVARWQQRLNPIQKVVACGCHLNRPIASLVERHGFRFETVKRFYAAKIPRTHGWITAGTAAKG
jgi:ubiquinone/menaquinone biosynthesis C-methylase UbiE